jgi:uncharacterized protein YdhG (YjbR/CyaY superfamily)
MGYRGAVGIEGTTEVDAYIAALDEQQRQAITAVRAHIHAAVAGLGETISYKMPAVTLDGQVVLFFAAWKKHIGLYPIPRFDGALEASIAPFRAATDTVRSTYRQPMPGELIEALTVAIVARPTSMK